MRGRDWAIADVTPASGFIAGVVAVFGSLDLGAIAMGRRAAAGALGGERNAENDISRMTVIPVAVPK
jgi:hypothetical protein